MLKDEANSIIMDLLGKILQKAQDSWLPLDFSSSFLRNAADFFLEKAASSEDKEFQSFCIGQALEFTYDEDLIDMIA